MPTVRIATRKSPLALWQAEHVATSLKQAHEGIQVELVTMTTRGDKILDTPLAKVGGKGLFVKELEQGLLNNDADIAVHSMKDVPVEFPDGLFLPVIMQREDPSDAFVSNQYSQLEELPEGAVVGTSSLRRQCQLRALRPDLVIHDLRGNVNTRLAKLDDGQYDAIILASAGLKRLGMAERITASLVPEQILPAIGQGAVGIECREGDRAILDLLQPLNHTATHEQVTAERAMNNRLAGGCQVPIAGFAVADADGLWMRGLVGSADGQTILRTEGRAPVEQAQELGTSLAEELLSRGADQILQSLLDDA